MFEAALWGAIGASSLLIGALIGLLVRLPSVVIGLVLGFGAGTLISAVSFELTEEAYALGGADAVVIGLAAGALAYFIGDYIVKNRGASGRMSPMGSSGVSASASTALLLGAVLDGIPESAVIGLTLLEGGSVGVAVLAAVFISNLPESISSTAGLKISGWRSARILWMWIAIALVSGLASLAGYGLFQNASSDVVAFVLAFAAGAILTMLADTMMPEAYEHGGKLVGVVTTLGFVVALALHQLD